MQNKRQNEISPHNCQNGYHQKEETDINQDMQKREPYALLGM